MTLFEAHRKILELDLPVLQTTDVAARLAVPRNHASKILARLEANGAVLQLKRGHWAIDKKIDRIEIPEYLTAPSPSYISLQTALFYHGMISQIAEVTYAVSTAKTRRHQTPFGTISIHHIEPEFFFGYESTGHRWTQMATPEKALLDFLYLSQAKSRLFSTLPEIELPKSFSAKRAREMLSRIPFAGRRNHVRGLFEEVLRQGHAPASQRG